MKNLFFCLLWGFVCAFFVSGCDLAQPKNKGQDKPPAAQNDPPPVEEMKAPPVVVQPVPNENNTVMVNAAPGMGGKGNYGTPTANNPMEIITVPVSTMFYAKDQLVLNSIQHAMNLYQAEHGKIPATHEEFMENIVRANMIALPQLPFGQEYVYDPMDGVLKIRKPR
ncbi:MAG: hypothetical protein LBI05_03455 [Planctomycetaceae bacterium]|jgi:hypothetical protein|nr:hypothetical protein [Planctomycetaceae bacterium]